MINCYKRLPTVYVTSLHKHKRKRKCNYVMRALHFHLQTYLRKRKRNTIMTKPVTSKVNPRTGDYPHRLGLPKIYDNQNE